MSCDEDGLTRWAHAGLISDEQRAAIEAFESGEAPGPPRISVAEPLIYVGLAAVLGSLQAVLLPLSLVPRTLILAGLSVSAGVGGTALLLQETRRLARAATVLLFFSTLFAAGAGVGLSGSGLRGAGRPLLFTGVPAFSLAFVYWTIHRTGTQLLAMFVFGILVVFGVANLAADITTTSGGLLLAAIGAAGLLAASRGLIDPVEVAYQLFGFALTIGTYFPSISGSGAAWAEVAAVVVAGALLGASVQIRSTELLLVGAFSVSLFAIVSIARHFQGVRGMPTVVLVLGALLVVRAVVNGRLRFFGQGT